MERPNLTSEPLCPPATSVPLPVAQRALAELLGTAGLVCAVVGSGIMAQRLSPHDAGLQLLENSLATVFALVALIFAFGPVSGAHMNPAVTITEWVRGALPGRDVPWYVGAQVVGGVAGAVLANAMFDLRPVHLSTHAREGLGLWIGEAVATAGLLLVIRGTVSSNKNAVPFAVATYIGAAYWFTSSTSFANPAVTVARMLSDTFTGIAPTSVPGFLVAQAVGAGVGAVLAGALFPKRALPGRPAGG